MMHESGTEDLRKVWAVILDWYQRNTPERMGGVGGPVSEDAIKAIESKVSARLPEEYKASLRIHNGGVAIHKYDLLAAEDVLSTWTRWKELSESGTFKEADVVYAASGEIQPKWWHEGWIPIARESGGDLLLIDTDPGPNGKLYQLVTIDRTEGPSVSRYRDFLHFLRSFADDIQANRYVLKEGDVNRA